MTKHAHGGGRWTYISFDFWMAVVGFGLSFFVVGAVVGAVVLIVWGFWVAWFALPALLAMLGFMVSESVQLAQKALYGWRNFG